MTTLGPQTYSNNLPQFVFPHNKQKKIVNNKPYNSYAKPQPYPVPSRAKPSYPQARPAHQDYYQLSSAKPYNTEFYGGKQHVKQNYSKKGAMLDKYYNAYASTASDSDENRYIPSELNGFKIVHDGEVLHDGKEDDYDSSDNEVAGLTVNPLKFASSVMTIGPNSKEISLPSFL